MQENPAIRPQTPHAGLPERERTRVRAILLLALVATLPLVSGAVDISATDASIATLSARPSLSDLGPLIYSLTDGISFSSSGSNVDLVWYADFTAATNNASAGSATIQGTSHTFTDWLYAKHSTATKFTKIKATGVYDSDAASYSVPLLFTQSSQGSFTLSWFDGTSPASTPSSTTFYWAYSSTVNRYVIGTSKDLSAETQIAPVTDTLGLTYTKTLETNTFVVTGVGSAPNYLPTVQQGRFIGLLSHPLSATWYVLMDTPDGVHEDTYSYTLQATALST